jgi:hypothetical protein
MIEYHEPEKRMIATRAGLFTETIRHLHPELADELEPFRQTTDHLRRLAREGGLPCIRRGRRMYFRVADLPMKSVRIDELSIGPYDPLADARRVAATRQNGGKDGA